MWEGEAPAEPETTAGRATAGGNLPLIWPPAVAELKLVLGSAGASPSHPLGLKFLVHRTVPPCR